MPSYSRAAWILIVPALALAAPRKSPKKPPPGTGSDTGSAATTEPAAGSAAAPAPDTGSAAPSSEPAGSGAKPDVKDVKETANKNEPDVDSLRQEYLALRDELFKSRARANAV